MARDLGQALNDAPAGAGDEVATGAALLYGFVTRAGGACVGSGRMGVGACVGSGLAAIDMLMMGGGDGWYGGMAWRELAGSIGCRCFVGHAHVYVLTWACCGMRWFDCGDMHRHWRGLHLSAEEHHP